MLADNFYRIAQEALTNAMQHSGASEILMELRHTERRLVLAVSDDGCGITPAADRSGGLGLHIMRARAELAGAQLKAGTRGSGGTRIECIYNWRI
jgi:signal transduction histidine kinase